MSGSARRLLAVTAVLALMATACGDSGDTESTEAGPSATSASTQGTSATPGDDTTVTFGTLPDDVPWLDDECLALAGLFTGMGAIGMALTGQSDLDLDGARRLFDEAKDRLPGPLHGDIDVMGEAIIGFYQALADVGIDLSDPQSVAAASPEQFEALNAASEILDSPEVQTAIDNLAAYGEGQCTGFAGVTP